MAHPNRSTKLRSYINPDGSNVEPRYEVWFCSPSGEPLRNNKPLGAHALAGARWHTIEHAEAAIADAYDDYERRQAKKQGLPQGPYATRCRTLGIPATVPAPRGRLKAIEIRR